MGTLDYINHLKNKPFNKDIYIYIYIFLNEL